MERHASAAIPPLPVPTGKIKELRSFTIKRATFENHLTFFLSKNTGDEPVVQRQQMNSMHRASGPLISSLLCLLLAVYLVNVFTPLRLTFDTVRYFNIKEWIEQGRPPGSPAASDFLPAGYVWFLLLLEKLHICISPVIAFLQLAFFVGGCYVICKVDANRKYFLFILAACLMNWTVLKFVITPLSEMQFLFLSCLAIFFFCRWEKLKRFGDILLCILFAALSVYTRTAGLSLVIAGILYFVITRFSILFPDRPFFPKVGPILIILGAALFVVLSDVIHVNEYIQFLTSHFKYGIGYTLGRNTWFHLIDFASLFLNMPGAKVPFVPQSITNACFAATGLAFLCLTVYLLVSRKTSMHLMLRLYLAVYLLMIFNWPYYEPRFFVPVIPVIALLLIRNFYVFPLLLRKMMRGYMVVYGLTAILALTYYTYTSLDNIALGLKQDAGVWRYEYETYFFGKPIYDTTAPVRKPIVELLRKYN